MKVRIVLFVLKNPQFDCGFVNYAGHGYSQQTCEGFKDVTDANCCYWEQSANDCWSDRGYTDCDNTTRPDSGAPVSSVAEYSAPESATPDSSSYVYDNCAEIKSENECMKSAHSSFGK